MAEEQRRTESHEERRDRTRPVDEETADISEEDISQLTLNHFKTALENFPNAERFVLKKALDDSIMLVPEDPDFTNPEKVALENKIVLRAFQLLLQAEFPEVDLSSFFENENFSFTAVLGAEKIKEILSDCEQTKKLEQLSKIENSFLVQHSDATPFLLSSQESKSLNSKTSWSWRSALLPSAMIFLSRITQSAAQPFAFQRSFWCPNGTKMGIVWEDFSSVQIHNTSENNLNLMPSSCTIAGHLYHQAQDAAEKVSQICFQNLEHPNNNTLQQEWEYTFVQSIPSKEHWMLAEASCQNDLSYLKTLQLSHKFIDESINASHHRQEEWIDAARWYPSIYTAEFQPDLNEYPYACVVDAAEEEGPKEGLKTRWLIIKGAAQFPYRHLESIFNTSTENILKQSAMGGDHLLVTLKEDEDPEIFRGKLTYLDPAISIKKDSPYGPEYILHLKKISLRFLQKILAACRSFAVSCDVNSYGSSTVYQSTDFHLGLGYYNSRTEPNDIYYVDQPNLKAIQAPQAWAVRHSAPHHPITVIDSGIHPHEDLNQNMWNNPKLHQNYGPYEYQHGFVADPSFNITPLDNHGTHCGGIAGAAANNTLGIAGVVWNASLMFCKATSLYFKKIDWQDRHVARCIDHASYANSSVISASYRDLDQAPKTLSALTRARNAGIIVVVPSGNDAQNLDHNFSYPASYAKTPHNPNGLDNIVVVGAVDDHDQWWPSSNYGANTVHLAAPGVGVLSTVVHNDTSCYERMDGTSMAVPHVAGVLALMKEHFPGKPYTWLIEKLLNSTDFLPLLNGNNTIYGRLNAARALEPTEVSESKDEACPVAIN